jgi:SAM-dependent methyltransferase
VTMKRVSRDGNRRLEDGRLVYYHKQADEKYWAGVWSPYANPEYYAPYRSGKLHAFEKMFTRHLPKHGMILEAGCGTAQNVVALKARGYDCVGLDYEFQAMRVANAYAGPLRLACGDITALGMASDSFDAIISIGVVEHRRAGPEPFLDEMNRILKPGGIMLISVPYFNPLRRWRAGHGAYQDDVSGLDFYQYAFTSEEFLDFIRNVGYEVEAFYSYAHQNSLSQELHWLKRMPSFINKFIMRVSKYVPYVNSEIGHMMMVAARKKLPEKK